MKEDTVIISMTSYPARIGSVYDVWKSILSQDRIEECYCVLVLTDEDFPGREEDLPENLLELIRSNEIEVIWHPTNIRSHKKLIPTLLKYPDNPILVIDDDVIRPDGWLSLFLESYEKYPDDIIGGAFSWWFDQDCKLRRFPDFKGKNCGTSNAVPDIVFATAKPANGYGGTLYPAHTFTDPRFFDEDLFMKLTPSSDESWHYCFAIMADKTYRALPQIFDYSAYYISGTQQMGSALHKQNNYTKINRVLFEEFPKFKEKLIERSKRIIVSLTSFKERLEFVPQTIQSILNGTMQPSKIVLTLDEKDVEFIPEDLRSMIDDGTVELLVSDYLIKPHTKYFLTMQKYRDYAIVTIDDDVEYSSDLLESLYKTYMNHPNCICARRCHRIKWSDDGTLLPYRSWQWQCTDYTEPRRDLFATGVGGVLYPPDILNINEDMLDDIRECLNADDIYLKWLEMNKGIKTVWVPNCQLHGLRRIDEAQEIALYKTNCNQNQNDMYLQKFPLSKVVGGIEEERATFTLQKVPDRSIVQPYMSECFGNFSNPIAVFTCCFNGETPIKYVNPKAEFFCFVSEYRNLDGWTPIVVGNFKRDPEWGIEYIKTHPQRYIRGFDKMIFIDSDYLMPDEVNLDFEEPLFMYNLQRAYQNKEWRTTLMHHNVNKLCMSKEDHFIIYNFENSNIDKLLTDIWAQFNYHKHPLRFAPCLPKYTKFVKSF